LYAPAIDEVNLQFEETLLPIGRKRFVGLQDTVRVELETEGVRFTVPEKEPRLVNRTDEVADEPEAKTIEDGFAAIPKSTMLTVKLKLLETEPLVPVTVTLYGPGVAVPEPTVRIEVPDPPEASCKLEELSESVGPEGVANAARLTSPAKPLWLPRVIVDVLDEPD
jgi:hypothetical protein